MSRYKYKHSNMLLDTEKQEPSVFPWDKGVHGNSTEIKLDYFAGKSSWAKCFFHLFLKKWLFNNEIFNSTCIRRWHCLLESKICQLHSYPKRSFLFTGFNAIPLFLVTPENLPPFWFIQTRLMYTFFFQLSYKPDITTFLLFILMPEFSKK